jgi:hypothetical protein
MDQKEGKQATIGNQVCEKLAAHLSIHPWIKKKGKQATIGNQVCEKLAAHL